MTSIMQTVDTPSIIRDAREELKTHVLTRMQIDQRIAELRILLRSLVRFIEDDGQRHAVLTEIENARRTAPSLTDAVSQVLAKSKKT